MNNLIKLNDNYSNKDNLVENLFEYEEYYLIIEKSVHKIIIQKEKNELIINCRNYYNKLNNNDLSKLVSSDFKNIDEAYKFIINIFEEDRVSVKSIITKKNIILLLKVNINNEEKNFEINLLYNKENKDLVINELNKSYNKLKNDIDNLKNEIKILNEEISKLKNIKNPNINQSPENIEFNSDPKDIKFLNDITTDSYTEQYLDNSFILFKSINNILYLIYRNKDNSIIFYNLINNKLINEIKKPHNASITNFRHYLDNMYKRDLVISISALDNNIKLWNVQNCENLLNIEKINKYASLYSACFLSENNELFIVSSNCNYLNSELIKVFDLKGNLIKKIDNSEDKVYYIDSYYDNKLSKNYIITGNDGYVKSYDLNQNKIYQNYNDYDKSEHCSIIIHQKEEIVKLIESSWDGNVRIWNFHSGELLNKIKVSKNCLNCICLWNNEYLFIGCSDNTIKLIELFNGLVLRNIEIGKDSIITIKKIYHPFYGECLISQGCGNGQIKLYKIKK